MGSTDSMKESQRRNIAFDILRIIAMLMVTICTLRGTVWVEWKLRRLAVRIGSF